MEAYSLHAHEGTTNIDQIIYKIHACMGKYQWYSQVQAWASL